MTDSSSTSKTVLLLMGAAAGPVALAAAVSTGGAESVAMLAILAALAYLVFYATATPVDMPTTLERVLTHLPTTHVADTPASPPVTDHAARLVDDDLADFMSDLEFVGGPSFR
jgi:hypothetical protein